MDSIKQKQVDWLGSEINMSAVSFMVFIFSSHIASLRLEQKLKPYEWTMDVNKKMFPVKR